MINKRNHTQFKKELSRLNRLSMPFPSTDTSQTRRNLQDENVEDVQWNQPISESLLQTLSQKERTSKDIQEDNFRTTKLAMCPASSSNGTVFEENIMLTYKSSKKASSSLI